MTSKDSSPRATKRTPAKRAPAIPFPDLPEDTTADALFWRAAWLRGEAKLAALREHVKHVYRLRRTTKPLRFALISAEHHLEDEAKINLERLVNSGGLLYAWLPEGGAA